MTNQSKREKIEAGAKYFAENYEGVMKELYEEEDNQQESWEEVYNLVKDKIKEIKARYPFELNIEGLEPALTSDIVEIVQFAIAQVEAKAFKAGMEETIEKMTVEVARLKAGRFNSKYHKNYIATHLVEELLTKLKE